MWGSRMPRSGSGWFIWGLNTPTDKRAPQLKFRRWFWMRCTLRIDTCGRGHFTSVRDMRRHVYITAWKKKRGWRKRASDTVLNLEKSAATKFSTILKRRWQAIMAVRKYAIVLNFLLNDNTRNDSTRSTLWCETWNSGGGVFTRKWWWGGVIEMVRCRYENYNLTVVLVDRKRTLDTILCNWTYKERGRRRLKTNFFM